MEPHDSVWTQDVRLRFQPQARSPRAFSELLEAIDTLGAVRWHSVDHENAQAIVNDAVRVRVGLDRLELLTYRGVLGDSAHAVLVAAAEIVRPVATRRLTTSQHLADLVGMEYDYARQAAAQAWLGPVGVLPGLTDSALLVDGVSEHLGATFQVEYGVVQGEEVSDRLLRTVGRLGASASGAARLPSTDEYPNVAVFADFGWRFGGATKGLDPDEVLAGAHGALEYASKFVTILRSSVSSVGEGGDHE